MISPVNHTKPRAYNHNQHGVTSTNTLVDVVQFFSEHVFQDLQAEPGTVHPLLQVDAIRFLYTFRTQVSIVAVSYLFKVFTNILFSAHKAAITLRFASAC